MTGIKAEYLPNTSQKYNSPCLVVMTGRMLLTMAEIDD
jgi:hypothetical protein